MKGMIDLMEIKSKEQLAQLLKETGYIANKQITDTLYYAMHLNSPLLLEGFAGTGKTYLAQSIASALNTRLIRVQCYEGLNYSDILYDWDYSKQILASQLLQHSVKEEVAGLSLKEAIGKIDTDSFYCSKFLLKKPLLDAITSDKRTVLLIDEVDKMDAETEAVLLEFLGELSITIPSIGTVKCKRGNEPIIILTSNGARNLSEALKRRCMYLFLEYPSEHIETTIIATQANVSENFANQVAKAVSRIRSSGSLKQKPSLAESITWAKCLALNLGVDANMLSVPKTELNATLPVLLKNKGDIDKAQKLNYNAGV
jgi:MoxR-like ATPase